jgi:hypothetical protein
MRQLATPVLMGFALIAAACPRSAEMCGDDRDPPVLRPEGDPNRAVQAELDLARRAATLEAYDLFIARHPEHRLAEVARRERAAIAARRRE